MFGFLLINLFQQIIMPSLINQNFFPLIKRVEKIKDYELINISIVPIITSVKNI